MSEITDGKSTNHPKVTITNEARNNTKKTTLLNCESFNSTFLGSSGTAVHIVLKTNCVCDLHADADDEK